MDGLSVTLSPRTVMRKKVRFLRRQGMVPVHFYGLGTEPQALQVEAGVLRRLLSSAGRTVPVKVEVPGLGGENICFVREVQRHPVSGEVLHVDFLLVDITRPIRADVPLVLVGESPAVKNLDGTLLQPLAYLQVESLPLNMPATLELDVSTLDDFEKSLRVSDVEAGPEVTLLRDPREMVARVAPPRIEEVEEAEGVEEGDEEAVEGEAAEEEAEAGSA